MPPSNRPPSRRRVLRLLPALGSVAVAGCFSPEMGGSVSELTVYNATGERIEASLEVYRLPEETRVIDDEFSLDSERTREYDRPFREDGRKRLELEVDGTRASYEWRARAEADSSGVDVTVSEDDVDVDLVGK